jgi:proteasome accessory factor C
MTRPTAGDRLRRLLALVPWLAANSPVRVEAVCERFGLDRRTLLADLEVLPYVGVPPYSPDTMIGVDLDDDLISIHLAEPFDRPLRITPTQALALIAAGHHIREVPGADDTDPLQRALAKLARALGVDPDQVHIDLGGGDEAVRTTLLGAIAQGRRVEIDHYSFGRDERIVRTVDPHQVVADQGHLYLLGWCHRSEDVRFFRLDRIASVTVLDEAAGPAGGDVPWDRLRPGDDAPRVTLDLAPEARWVAEHHPHDRLEEAPEGHLLVTLGVAAPAWLERLLVSLGPDARVVDAPPELRSTGADTAARILARYGEA